MQWGFTQSHPELSEWWMVTIFWMGYGIQICVKDDHTLYIHIKEVDIHGRKARGVLSLIASFDAPSVQIPVFCWQAHWDLPEKIQKFRISQWACWAKNRYLDRWGIEAGNQKECLFGSPCINLHGQLVKKAR